MNGRSVSNVDLENTLCGDFFENAELILQVLPMAPFPALPLVFISQVLPMATFPALEPT